jgi:hypothetical protein
LQDYVNKLERSSSHGYHHHQNGLNHLDEDSSSSEEEAVLPTNFQQERNLLLLDFDSTLEETQPYVQALVPSQRMPVIDPGERGGMQKETTKKKV